MDISGKETTMDKETRGRLLVNQEESEQKIKEIRGRLTVIGQMLQGLADALLSQPERIVFANAPSPLGDSPIDLINVPSFNWDKFPKIEDIAKLIQDLRREQYLLSDIQQKLR
jgi:hypothetical protein